MKLFFEKLTYILLILVLVSTLIVNIIPGVYYAVIVPYSILGCIFMTSSTAFFALKFYYWIKEKNTKKG